MEISLEELLIALALKEEGVKWNPKEGDWFAHHVHFPEYNHLGFFNVGQVDEHGKIPNDDEYCIYDEDTWLPTISQVISILRTKGVKAEFVTLDGTYKLQMGDCTTVKGETELSAYYLALLSSIKKS